MLRNFLKRCKGFLYGITEESCLVYRCRDYTSSMRIRNFMKLVSFPFCLMRYFFKPRMATVRRNGLAVALIAKNEAPYIKEWVEFHHKQGVSHFFIYDNESADNLHEVLKPYIDSGLVTYRLIRGRMRQTDAYNMALHECRRKFRYMAILDADEFLFMLKDTDNLYEFVDNFMKSHKNAGGLAVNWCIFGSGGHITKPEGGLLENYTMRAEDDFPVNLHIKTICDTVRTMCFNHVHYPIYRRGFYNFDEESNIVPGAFTERVRLKRIRINHYFTKSREEFMAKRARGMADNLGIRSVDDFAHHDKNIVVDREILSHR